MSEHFWCQVCDDVGLAGDHEHEPPEGDSVDIVQETDWPYHSLHWYHSPYCILCLHRANVITGV